MVRGLSNSQDELNTDNFYLNCYYTFFRSKAGGAYEESEITTIEEPTAKELNSTTANSTLNYCIIVLIGHGASQENNQLFQLNKDEIILAGQLNPNCEKNLIILESCRSEIENVLTVDLNDKLPKFKYGGIVRSPINRQKARELYNEHLKNCKVGQAVCFACRKGEEAYNYYFSMGLIQSSFNWHLESGNHYSVLPIDGLMSYLSIEIPKLTQEKISENQTPEIIGNFDFPIAVSKF